MTNVILSDKNANNVTGTIRQHLGDFYWVIMNAQSSSGHGSDNNFRTHKEAEASLIEAYPNVVILKVTEFKGLRASRDQEIEVARQAELDAKREARQIVREVEDSNRAEFWANVSAQITFFPYTPRPRQSDFTSSKFASENRRELDEAYRVWVEIIESGFTRMENSITPTVADVINYPWIFEGYDLTWRGMSFFKGDPESASNETQNAKMIMVGTDGVVLANYNMELGEILTATKRESGIKITYHISEQYENPVTQVEFKATKIENADRQHKIEVTLSGNEDGYHAEISTASLRYGVEDMQIVVALLAEATKLAEAWTDQNILDGALITKASARKVMAFLAKDLKISAIKEVFSGTQYDLTLAESKLLVAEFQAGTYSI